MSERRQHPLAIGLEGVDAQIERRAAGEPRPLLGPLRAEYLGEMWVEPFRIIAGDPGRRARDGGAFARGTLERGTLRGLERGGRMARAVAQARDRLHVELALQPQHAEHQIARLIPAHEGNPPKPCGGARHRGQARDGGAIAGAGELLRQAPRLEGVVGRPPLRLDLAEHLDSCRVGGPGCHSPYCTFKM